MRYRSLVRSFEWIACAYFAIDAATVHTNDLVLALSLAVAFACAGFLPFNVRPNKPAAAFLGDSGSQVLGFSLATIALASSWKAAAPSLATVLLPLLVLAVPILDTTLVTVVRALERPRLQRTAGASENRRGLRMHAAPGNGTPRGQGQCNGCGGRSDGDSTHAPQCPGKPRSTIAPRPSDRLWSGAPVQRTAAA